MLELWFNLQSRRGRLRREAASCLFEATDFLLQLKRFSGSSDSEHTILAQGRGDSFRLDTRWQREPLLKLLRNEASARFGLCLPLGQDDEHVTLCLDGELLRVEVLNIKLNLELAWKENVTEIFKCKISGVRVTS